MNFKDLTYQEIVVYIITAKTGDHRAWEEISRLDIKDAAEALEYTVSAAQRVIDERKSQAGLS